MRDLKWILGLLGICLLILAVMTFFFPSVSAFGITQNITDVSNIIRINQGSTVYLNETYDISGVTGWATQLAWYGEYIDFPNSDIAPVLITLPGKAHTAKESQYYFTINNDTVGRYPGKWFQYYKDDDGEHGNLEAFKVVRNKPFYLNQTNVSGIVSYNITSNVNIQKIIKPYILEEVKVSDHLIARGDNFNITTNGSTHAWLFGRLNYLYDHKSINGTINIEKKFLEGVEPGSYTLLLQTPIMEGTDFTVRYNNIKNSIDWFDPTMFAIHSEPLEGYSPQVVLEKLKNIFPSSHDKYEIYKLEIQDPSISINKIDQVYKNGTTVLDIRGYTNTALETVIKLTLDKDKQTARTLSQYTYIGNAKGDLPGNMRYYQIYVPIALDSLPNGMHTISATTDIGGEVFADFLVSELPADSYVPNATLKYIGDRNPWVPTPTPEVIIKKEVVSVPGPVVTVIVTPSNEQVRAQQEKIIGESNAFWIPRIITAIIGLIVLVYLVSVHLRRKNK